MALKCSQAVPHSKLVDIQKIKRRVKIPCIVKPHSGQVKVRTEGDLPLLVHLGGHRPRGFPPYVLNTSNISTSDNIRPLR